MGTSYAKNGAINLLLHLYLYRGINIVECTFSSLQRYVKDIVRDRLFQAEALTRLHRRFEPIDGINRMNKFKKVRRGQLTLVATYLTFCIALLNRIIHEQH